MTIGEKLRQAREARAITLHEIAEHTNISVRFLDALEKGQIDKLPGGIFTRGFVRSYASQVGLDPDDTVRQYVAAHPAIRTDEEVEAGEPTRSAWPVLLAVALVLLLGIGGGWYLWSSMRASARPSAALDRVTAAANPPPLPDSVAMGGAQGTSPPEATDGAGEPAASPGASGAAPAPGSGATATDEATAEPSLASGLPLRLTLVPTGRCWVQVRADGRVRLAREVVAGERVDIEAAEVLEIVAGDAGAFAYRLNGAPGRPLGAAGRIGRATITPANVADYQNGIS